MKWIRTVVTVVIMIVSVGVIALGINNLTQETVREEVVTFEILEDGNVTGGTYNLLIGLIEYDVTLEVNNNIVNTATIGTNEFDDIVISNSDGDHTIADDDYYTDDGFGVTIGDIFELTFEVPQPPILTGTIAIILGLVPLIVASGVLYFMLRKNNLGD